MSKPQLSQEVAESYLDKFPTMPSQTMAKMLLKREKHVYPTLNAARCAIRRLRGAAGDEKRNLLERTGREPAYNPGDLSPFAKLPEPIDELSPWGALKIAGNYRIAVLSDTHIPYQDQTALVTALNRVHEFNPHIIILNGDIGDFYQVSSFERDPRQVSWKRERDKIREFLRVLRSAFPKARIIYKQGNHEIRWDRYLMTKAPEIYDDIEELVGLRKILELGKVKIEMIDGFRPILLGDRLYVMHGHEWKAGITPPVNPARGLYLKAKECCLVGHHHRTSSHTEVTLGDRLISTWSTGCLSNLHPRYNVLNNYNHGFATITLKANSSFEVNNLKIIKGKIYAD